MALGLFRNGDHYSYDGKTVATLNDCDTSLVEVNVSSGTTKTQSVAHNRFYKFSGNPVTELRLALISPQIDDALPVYAGKFVTDAVGCDFYVTLPNTISVSQLGLQGDATYEFYIVDNELTLVVIHQGGNALSSGYNIAGLCAGEGSLSDAISYANTNNVKFQWLLIDTVDDNSITKVIWHIGNGVFIDALGATISYTVSNA